MQGYHLAVWVKHNDCYEILINFLFVLHNSAPTAQAHPWKGSQGLSDPAENCGMRGVNMSLPPSPAPMVTSFLREVIFPASCSGHLAE